MRNRHPLNGNTYPTRPLLKHNSRSKLGGGWETKARLTAHVKLTASLEVNHLSPTACLGSMVQSGNSNSQIRQQMDCIHLSLPPLAWEAWRTKATSYYKSLLVDKLAQQQHLAHT